MFDRIGALGFCSLLSFACGCAPKDEPPAQEQDQTPSFTRHDGPAYIVSPASGILTVPADSEAARPLPLARHRPGRSVLWLDGRTLGPSPDPWQLERDAMLLPLSGGMVQGLHEVALFTSAYARFPRSASLVIAVSPASPKALELRPSKALRSGVSRIYYPGQGTLFGASLAWSRPATKDLPASLEFFSGETDQTTQILMAPKDPPLEEAWSMALHHQAGQTQVLALFPQDPQTLWHWHFEDTQRTLTKHRLAPRSSQTQPDPNNDKPSPGAERIAVDASGFWINAWYGRSHQPSSQRPGDWRVFQLAANSQHLRQALPQDYGASAQKLDLRIDGTLQTLSPQGSQTHLSMAMDSWNPRRGPAGGPSAGLYNWKKDPRVALWRHCATQSPLLDEIWVGLDAQAKPHAGTRVGTVYTPLALPDASPQDTKLASAALDCSVVQGRFVAALPRRGAPLELLHFDGEKMHRQSSDVSCQDAAFRGWGEESRLWCLQDGSLFPITLQWQPLPKSAEP